MFTPKERKLVEQLVEFEARGIQGFESSAWFLGEIVTPENYDAIAQIVPATWKERLDECIAAHSRQVLDAECLEPEYCPFDLGELLIKYHRDVAAALFVSPSQLSSHYRLSVVCLPSFDVEWCVRLLWAKRGDPSLVLTVAERKIWLGDSAANTPVALHRAPLATDMAGQLEEIWDRMLCRTRFPERSGMGLDGVTYHFSNGAMAGKTWSPDPGTAPGRFAELSHRLREYCAAEKGRRSAFLAQIDELARGFLRS
jgi:hypothetical protein